MGSNPIPCISDNLRYLQAFLRELTALGLSEGRIKRYENVLKWQFESQDRDCNSANKHDIMKWLLQLQTSDLAEDTKYTYKCMVRKFYRWLGNKEAVNWMPVTWKRTYKDPAEILTKDEIDRITRHTPYFRDRVYISTLWGVGVPLG